MIRLIAAIAISIILASCSGVPERLDFNTRGVTHVDVDGGARTKFDAARSFFPIGLYHALSGTWNGQSFDLMRVRQARFNAVILWEGQKIVPAVRAAAAVGLRSVVHFPSDDEIRALKDEPLVLGWYLDEEPSYLLGKAASPAAVATFQARRAAIRKIDERRPVFIIDGPHTSKLDEVWRRWATVGDISAHFNYPVTVRKIRALTPPQRVGETVALARDLNNGKKPLWFVVQAFGGRARGWFMPTPAEYRAMVYSAVLHGATGIFVFAYDSFVLRDDGIIGVRADPRAAYPNDIDFNNDGKPPYVASRDELKASRLLWRTVIKVNVELKTLGPWILSPTDADTPLVADVLKGRGGDVVYVIKRRDNRRLLIVQNSGTSEITLRLSLPDRILGLKPLFDRNGVDIAQNDKGGWLVRLQPYGIAVLNLESGKGGRR